MDFSQKQERSGKDSIEVLFNETNVFQMELDNLNILCKKSPIVYLVDGLQDKSQTSAALVRSLGCQFWAHLAALHSVCSELPGRLVALKAASRQLLIIQSELFAVRA